MTAAKTPALLPGESLIFSSGIHWKNLLGPGAITAAALAALLSPAHHAGKSLFDALLRAVGADMFSVAPEHAATVVALEDLILLYVAFKAVAAAVRLLYTGYFVTTRRVIRTTGWLNTRSTEIQISRCKVIDVTQSLWEKAFSTGDIRISTAETTLFFDDVPQVKEFAAKIQERVSEIENDIMEL